MTVYPVIAAPPLLAGTEKLIIAKAFPATALTLVGAPGGFITTTGGVGVGAGVSFFEQAKKIKPMNKNIMVLYNS